ncbi:MAG: T9SS type A sorting domain-containing protein [Flavobacteriales bacterium]|nr:T9SS type A sorting domain-containing protein [Flavobacteriales bacterium]
MRLLHVVFCLSLALVSNAQQWCMPSATWRSRSWSIEGGGYREITCEGDSVILGVQAHRMKCRFAAILFGELVTSTSYGFIAETDDLLRYYSEWDGTPDFDTLAWFGASIGDHWMIAPEVRADVIGTGERMIDGVPLRYVAVAMNGYIEQDTIFERIGPLLLNPLEPYMNFMVDYDYAGLLCYHDDQMGYLVGDSSMESCMAPLTVPDARNTDAHFTLSPNPGTDRLSITADPALASNTTVHLMDAQGRVIATTSLGVARSFWSIGEVARGCYMVRILDGVRAVNAMKWVRE